MTSFNVQTKQKNYFLKLTKIGLGVTAKMLKYQDLNIKHLIIFFLFPSKTSWLKKLT